eukprot:320762_1
MAWISWKIYELLYIIWYIFLATSVIILLQSYWNGLLLVHLCTFLPPHILTIMVTCYFYLEDKQSRIKTEDILQLINRVIGAPYVPYLMSSNEYFIGVSLNVSHIISTIILYYNIETSIRPILTTLCFALAIIYFLILTATILLPIISLCACIMLQNLSLSLNIWLELLLAYYNIVMIYYTNIYLFAPVTMTIFCLNLLCVYNYYISRYHHQNKYEYIILQSKNNMEKINKCYAWLHCQHYDVDHPSLSTHDPRSYQCFKLQHDFMKMRYNQKIKWLRAFRSFMYMNDDRIYTFSVISAHILPICWFVVALKIYDNKQSCSNNFILIDDKYQMISLGIINVVYFVLICIMFPVMKDDKYNVSSNTYLIMTKINSVPYNDQSITDWTNFYSNLYVVEAVMDCLHADIACIVLNYVFE